MSVNQGFLTAVELANPPAHLLRAEAAVEPDPVPTQATKETQIIAIYGKGGTRPSRVGRLNGFCSRLMPASSRPSWPMAFSVYPDM